MPDLKSKITVCYYRAMEKFSPRQLYYHWKAGLPAEHLLASFDQDGLGKLLKYRDDTGHPQYRKYFNAPYWLRQNVTRALRLGLNRREALSILDIGSGFGYFPYVAHFYGHDVIGMDVPGDVLFDKASDFLGVDRRHHKIEAKEKLPSYDRKFDLITAFQVCFNGHIEGKIWGREAWDFFLKDVFANHVNKGGRLYLELNWSPHIQGWLPDVVRELFIDVYGAQFDGPSRVTLFAPKG